MRSIFLALTVTTAYAQLRGWPAELHPVLRACFAVLVLVLGVGLWRKRERPVGSHARAVRAPRWPDYLAVGMGVLAVECLFLFFLSAAPPRAELLALKLEEAVHPERAAVREEIVSTGGGGHATVVSGNWLWDSQGRRELPRTTNAKPSNKPEVFFQPASRETASQLLRSRPYLGAFALERFNDGGWSPVAMNAETITADATGWISLPQPSTRPGPVLRGEVFHPADPNAQDVFSSLQGPTQAKLDQLRRIAPGILRLNPLRDPATGYRYEVAAKTVSFASLLESGVLERFELPAIPPSHLVELPEDEELRQALFDIAIKTQGPIEARLLALQRVLKRDYQYSLETTNERNLDPLLNFLLHEKRGHCELFATAGALLCRTLDIPARIAYGWSGGRYFEAQNLFMFRAREAHAWTEIYLKDVGWVVFDTTPPSALDFSIAAPDEQPPLDEDGRIDYGPEAKGNKAAHASTWTFIALGAGLGLIPLALLVLRFRKRPTRLPGAASTSLLPDAPGYLERFRQVSARLGTPMPAGRTLRQQLAALARDDRAPDFARDLLEYHYAITYGGARPNKIRESALLRSIKRWS